MGPRHLRKTAASGRRSERSSTKHVRAAASESTMAPERLLALFAAKDLSEHRRASGTHFRARVRSTRARRVARDTGSIRASVAEANCVGACRSAGCCRWTLKPGGRRPAREERRRGEVPPASDLSEDWSAKPRGSCGRSAFTPEIAQACLPESVEARLTEMIVRFYGKVEDVLKDFNFESRRSR